MLASRAADPGAGRSPSGAWIANSDAALDASGPEAVRAAYVEEDFASYYSSAPASQFAAEVTFNNIQVSITAFALGILACVGTAAILVFNGANVGVAGGLFAAVGEPGKFWGLILPHGLLEITAVIVAGGAGLRLGWALIDPGDRTRGRALTEEGRRSVIVILGLVFAFVTAGLIEGFVTGSPLPDRRCGWRSASRSRSRSSPTCGASADRPRPRRPRWPLT